MHVFIQCHSTTQTIFSQSPSIDHNIILHDVFYPVHKALCPSFSNNGLLFSSHRQFGPPSAGSSVASAKATPGKELI